jgi:hypothetical protein
MELSLVVMEHREVLELVERMDLVELTVLLEVLEHRE